MKKAILTLLLSVLSIRNSYAEDWNVTLNLGTGGSNQLENLILQFSTITGMLVPVLIALAVLAFFWFLVTFIWKGAEDPKKHADAMKGMGASLVAIFVMVSVWGIIAFMGTVLGIGQGGAINEIELPGVRRNGGSMWP